MKLTTGQKLKLNILSERVLGILYPRTCPVCGDILKADFQKARITDTETEMSFAGNPFLCQKCQSKIDPVSEYPRCMRCSKPLDDEREEYCRDCTEKQRWFDRGEAAIIHNEAARELVYDLKYHGLKVNADAAAYEIARNLIGINGHGFSQLLDVDAIIPVPLHRDRQRERGYNQAALIAKRLEFFLELAGHEAIIVDEGYLIRNRKTLRLKELSGAERVADIAGAFAVEGAFGKYKKVLLVDDIFTSGATLNECAKTLKDAGVSVVYFVTVSIGS